MSLVGGLLEAQTGLQEGTPGGATGMDRDLKGVFSLAAHAPERPAREDGRADAARDQDEREAPRVILRAAPGADGS